MVTRQRRAGFKRSNDSTSTAKERGILSRRAFLFSILTITTAIFLSLLISRYKNGNSATARLIASALGKGKNNKPFDQTIAGTRIEGDDALKKRIAAIANRFKDEIGSVVNGEEKEKISQGVAEGVSIVPSQQDVVVDHERQNPLYNAPPHVEEKTDKEAIEDQRAALQDLDQETIKAMFDALYARG